MVTANKHLDDVIDEVIVVDPQFRDYRQMFHGASDRGQSVRMLSRGDDALRLKGVTGNEVWLINYRLPDMSGVDLLELVRQRNPKASVLLIGDEYDTEDELDARSAGATAHVCKPADGSWLDGVRRPKRTARSTDVKSTNRIRHIPSRFGRSL